MKLDLQPINCGHQLLVGDRDTGEMYGVLEVNVTSDSKFSSWELLDAIYRRLGIDGVEVTE